MRFIARQARLLRHRVLGGDHAQLPPAAAHARLAARRPDPPLRHAIQNNPDLIKQLKASLGSEDEPIWSAYPTYLHNILTGNLGMSTAQQVPVTEIIGNTLPYSIFLVGIGFILSFVIGTFLGMLAAWRRGGFTDRVGTPGLMALQSFPAFFLSLVAVYFLGLKLGWFPIQHAYSNDSNPGHLVVLRSRTGSATPSCRSS